MLNQRIEAARPIAKKINEVEKSLNLTMIQMGELMSSIAAARLAPGTRFSLTAGMDASEKLPQPPKPRAVIGKLSKRMAIWLKIGKMRDCAPLVGVMAWNVLRYKPSFRIRQVSIRELSPPRRPSEA